MDGATTISVVIVNWNSKDDLRACLTSLEAQTDPHFETIVVDNGSTDGSLEMLRTEFPQVVLVDTGQNLGFAEGCNRGFDVARGTWIGTLNNDAVAAPNWIAELRLAASGCPDHVGMFQTKVLFKHDTARTNSTGVLIFRDGAFIDRDFDKPDARQLHPEEIFCPSAGAALYRRKMLDQVRLDSGFLDRGYFMYFEDVDLGWRCRLAGWSAIYLPSAVVVHAFHGSASRRGRDFVSYQCYKNRLRTLLKNGSLPYLLRSLWRLAREGLWSLRTQRMTALRAYGAAISEGIAQRKAVSRLSKVDRSRLEKRWVVRSGLGQNDS